MILNLRSLAGMCLSIPVDNSSTLNEIQTSILMSHTTHTSHTNISTKNRIIVFVDHRFTQNATLLPSSQYAILTHQSKLVLEPIDTIDTIEGIFVIDNTPMVYRCLKSIHNGRSILPLVYESNEQFVYLKLKTFSTRNVFTLADRQGKSLWTYNTYTPGCSIYLKIDMEEWCVDLMISNNNIHRLDILESPESELYVICQNIQLKEMSDIKTKAYDTIKVKDYREQVVKWRQQLCIK